MIYEKFNLNDYYPFLKEYGADAFVEAYIQECPAEMYESYKKPAMVVCPGSGYELCTRREAEPVAIRLMAMDFNVFVITYSCDPVHYPVQLLAIAALYELINKNSDKWNVDTEKIGIMGFSAGGHLAAHYSNCYGCDEIKAHFDNTYKPSVAVLCYPVISVDDNILNTPSFEKLLGHRPNADDVEKFSAENMVTKDTPPTFIWHTAEDKCVFVENSLRYATALSRNEVPFTLHVYPHGFHGLATGDVLTNNGLEPKLVYVGDWMDQLEKWIKITL